MDQELDPSHIELTEEEEELLKEHLGGGDSGSEDESFFTLEELTTEFNDTKVRPYYIESNMLSEESLSPHLIPPTQRSLDELAKNVGFGSTGKLPLPTLTVLYDVKTAVATHYGEAFPPLVCPAGAHR